MNSTKAQQICGHIYKLAELVSTYNARYGSEYKMQESSPVEAWDLYRRIMAEQATIASLLEREAVLKPFVRFEPWWENRDVMQVGLVNELAAEGLRLVEMVSYKEALGEPTKEIKTLIHVQEAIVGMLHPRVRQRDMHHSSSIA